MKVLVTGSSGFIGARLCELLRANPSYSVIRALRSPARLTDSVDLRLEDPDSIARAIEYADPEIVVHCAGIAKVEHSDASEYYRVNSIGTESLIKTLIEHGPKRRFIFLSTAGIYGNQNSPILDESMMPQPVHHYGGSKYVAECFVQSARELLDISILRLFNLIGPGQSKDFLIPKLISHFMSRAPVINLGNISVRRDFSDLDSVCYTIIDSIETSSAIGETLNICSGHAVSLEEVIDALTELTEHRVLIRSTESLIRRNEVWDLVGSTKKLDRILPNRKKPIPLREALALVIRAEYKKSEI